METASLIDGTFKRSGISLTEKELAGFCLLYDLIVSHNDELDLTRITRPEDIIVKHFIDSTFVLTLADIPSPVLDIGTGAGFPGIPLKIMNSGLRVILAEPKHRRVAFMKMAIDRLGLTNAEIYPHLVTDLSFFDVRGVITRALEPVKETLERVDHFLPANGRVLFMKGPGVDGELSREGGESVAGFEIEDDKHYTLPGTEHRRRLLIYRKTRSDVSRTYCIMRNSDEQVGNPISSEENRRYRELKKLTSIEGMKKSGMMLVSGKKIIIEELNENKLSMRSMVIFDGYIERDETLRNSIHYFAKSGNLFVLKKALYNQLDITGSEGPILVTDMPAPDDWSNINVQGCILAVPFQDPVNVGAVIRSALGFGVKKILLLREAANPFHPKSVRASSGAVFRAELFRGPSIVELGAAFPEQNIMMVTLDRDGSPLDDFEFPDNFILIPGLEGPGLPEDLKIGAVSIPLDNGVDSLNGPAAVAVVLYRWRLGSSGVRAC